MSGQMPTLFRVRNFYHLAPDIECSRAVEAGKLKFGYTRQQRSLCKIYTPHRRDVAGRYCAIGTEPVGSTQGQAAAFIREEVARCAR
jgi:hypothetical protein